MVKVNTTVSVKRIEKKNLLKCTRDFFFCLLLSEYTANVWGQAGHAWLSVRVP